MLSHFMINVCIVYWLWIKFELKNHYIYLPLIRSNSHVFVLIHGGQNLLNLFWTKCCLILKWIEHFSIYPFLGPPRVQSSDFNCFALAVCSGRMHLPQSNRSPRHFRDTVGSSGFKWMCPLGLFLGYMYVLITSMYIIFNRVQ